jgi:hypothetical protein
MQWTSRAVYFLRRLLHGGRAESELEQEVQAYFDTMVERRMAQGLTREEARRATRLEYGGSGPGERAGAGGTGRSVDRSGVF